MYKLVAIDMDGTLLQSNHTISDGSKQAIDAIRDKGVKVVIATGRPLDGVRSYIKELDMTTDEDYVICFNGALVQSIASENIVGRTVLKGEDLHYVYDIAKNLGLNIQAFSTKGCIAPKMSKYTEVECKLNGIDCHIVDFNDIDNNEDIIKIMIIDEPEVLDEAIPKLPKELYTKFTVVRSMPFFLEFSAPNANKGEGLEKLAHHLNIKQDEIISIGDAGNDAHMIEYAGMGVAMGNAFDEIKQIAQFITKSNDDEGVAHALTELVLNSY